MELAERRFLLVFASVTTGSGLALLAVAHGLLKHRDTGSLASMDWLYLVSGVPVGLAGIILLAVAVLCLRDWKVVSEA